MKWILIFLLGCSSPAELTFPDVPDSGNVCDIPGVLETDIQNCGTCGHVCSPPNADSCRGGVCFCGEQNPCGRGEDCRFGACHAVDENGSPCEFDDQCPSGFACLEGRCSFIQCAPEECDGIDNDCDGQIDAIGGMPLSAWCYEGISEFEMLMEPCHPGVTVCDHGTWTECVGDVPPINEIGTLVCDGTDNNCDGCIDGQVIDGVCVPIVILNFDIVFAIDTSGSMSDEIMAVIDAVDDFSARFRTDPSFRFAIVNVPGTSDMLPSLRLDFSEYLVFVAGLRGSTAGFSSGLEPSWDAVYLLGTESSELRLSWRPDALRIIILFTDEYGQSYRTPAINEMSMCDSLDHGEVLAVFTTPGNYDDFDACATTFELTNDSMMLLDSLNSIISDPCHE